MIVIQLNRKHNNIISVLMQLIKVKMKVIVIGELEESFQDNTRIILCTLWIANTEEG